MRWLPLVVVLGMVMLMAMPQASAQREPYFHVDRVTMQLEGYNATFMLEFHLDTLANAYVLLFGSNAIRPDVMKFFSNFSEVKVLSLQRDRAYIRVVNITHSLDERQDRIYFLYPPYHFSQRVPIIVIRYPDGSRLELYNRDTTPAKIATVYK
ncbi:MAG: hypothetical protein PWR26_1014 [Methanosarcinales archaeon]|nr:hypothetical protein [Methanosarcinales archaeon]